MAAASDRIVVEVVVAWPRRHLRREVALPPGATVADALAAALFDGEALDGVVAFAVHGERVASDARVSYELLCRRHWNQARLS